MKHIKQKQKSKQIQDDNNDDTVMTESIQDFSFEFDNNDNNKLLDDSSST